MLKTHGEVMGSDFREAQLAQAHASGGACSSGGAENESLK